MQQFITILNGLMGLLLLYCLVSIPVQFIRRLRRRRAGLVVSPMSLVAKKFVKNWAVAMVIVIPLAVWLTLSASRAADLMGVDLYAAIITGAVLGNLGTSMLVGYAFMQMNKARWSHSRLASAKEENNG